MQDWLGLSAAELGRGIGAGEIDPVALCDVYLAAIEAHEFTDRIYARLTVDRARAEAAAASERAKAGLRRGPLDGVPVSWKDLFDTAGVGTEAGTKVLEGRVPDRDAEVLRIATAQGLVCLGKTHMSEVAFSGLGYNPNTATTPCVNDHGAVAGGSSSGAAGSVAFGLAPIAIGSDTGGSVRIPAGWNDLVGLKTTIGRVSVEGSVPLCQSFDTVGPLCRSVEDAALMLAVLDGGAVADLRGATLEGVRLMVLETIAMDDLEEAPARAFDGAIAQLEAAGAVVERRAVPGLVEAFAYTGPLFTAEAYNQWGWAVESVPELMFEEILQRIDFGKTVMAVEYLAGWDCVKRVQGEYAEVSAGFDAVILPSSPILPPNVARLISDGDYYKHSNLMALRNTRVANLMGLSSLTLPTGVPSCGIMFNGTAGGEEKLLRIGAAAEAVLG